MKTVAASAAAIPKMTGRLRIVPVMEPVISTERDVDTD